MRRNHRNILFLLYEDLQQNLQQEILKVAEFLGENYLQQMTHDDCKLLKKITEAATFKSMAKQKNDAWVSIHMTIATNTFITPWQTKVW